MTSQSIADDVTITRQFWCDHVNSDIYSLDIDFIHGDIHGRLRKTYPSLPRRTIQLPLHSERRQTIHNIYDIKLSKIKQSHKGLVPTLTAFHIIPVANKLRILLFLWNICQSDHTQSVRNVIIEISVCYKAWEKRRKDNIFCSSCIHCLLCLTNIYRV